MIEIKKLTDVKIRVYFVNKYDKEQPTTPNTEHLYRRICSTFHFGAESDSEGFVEFKIKNPNSFKEDTNYLRAYCKARGMFVKKIVILDEANPIFESILKEIDNETESVYQEDTNPILHFKSDNLIKASD